MQDTFFLPDDASQQGEKAKKLLRTHTSPVQIRHMTSTKPPFKIICFGRTYRSDYDMTHTPMFHQMECLYVGKDVTMGHLKGCLTDFVQAFFGIDDLPAATLGASTRLAPGDEVVAVGFPFGIGPSISAGVVSGLNREFRSPEGKRVLTRLIQGESDGEQPNVLLALPPLV